MTYYQLFAGQQRSALSIKYKFNKAPTPNFFLNILS